MNCIETINTTWQEFVKENTVDKDKYIYRGHSNTYSNSKFDVWKLLSSYNRAYKEIPFRSFISQQLEDDLFRNRYGNYKFVLDNELVNMDVITKLYFLQHYGIPTCLLDFTYNPLIALYFAMANIIPKNKQIDIVTKNINSYKTNNYISIYKIDYTQLLSKFNIKPLIHTDSFELSENYNEYAIGIYDDQLISHIALDLKPEVRINNRTQNYNLTNQACCFLLYDNYEMKNHDYDFGSFLDKISKEKELKFESPVIQIFNIEYNSILGKKLQDELDNPNSLFSYLKQKQIYGGELFNDSQGLKYDFKFFNELMH